MHFVVSLIDKELAGFIGKKGSENSITFYNRIYNEHVIVGLMPTNIEEKAYALAQSILLSGQAVLSTDNIDKFFGEAAVALGLVGKKVIFTGENDPSSLAKAAGISEYEVVGKEELLEKIVSFKEEAKDQRKRVDIDKAFVVRGVGSVVLGIVRSGEVAVHDVLYTSSGKEVLVRSIQSQDRDIEKAPINTRVGLAIKGVDAEEIEKGEIFSSERYAPSDTIRGRVKIAGISGEALKEGSTYGLAVNFSYSSCTVTKVNGDEIEAKLDKKVPFFAGDNFFLIRQKMPRLFASGVIL